MTKINDDSAKKVQQMQYSQDNQATSSASSGKSEKLFESNNNTDYSVVTSEQGNEVNDCIVYTVNSNEKNENWAMSFDLKDEATALSMFNTYDIDINNYEFKKDSKGNITDIYPKNLDKSADSSHSVADRYSLRYDAEGHLIKSFIQDIDENGNVVGQEITNYNSEGEINTVYYRYTYDENGNQTSQTRLARSTQYNDDALILKEIFGEKLENERMRTTARAIGDGDFSRTFDNKGDVKYNNDGKISEIIYNGNSYMLRYDDEGNLKKAIKQSFREDGTINNQEITTFGSDGAKIKEVRTYDDQGVENTSNAQKAVNNVRKLYTTKSSNVRESENASNKLKAFIENNTLAKLNAAGVSKEDIEALMKELFGNELDKFLYDNNFLDTNLKGLYTKFEQQKQKIGLEQKLFY